MRVAVHLPEGHPHGSGVVAYKLGRIRDGVDNHVIHTGETTPIEEFVAGLVEQAKRDYPEEGVQVKVERLVDNGDDTMSWVDAEQFDPDEHEPAAEGESKSAEINVESRTEAN